MKTLENLGLTTKEEVNANYQELAVAIIEQAAQDYVKAKRKFVRSRNKDSFKRDVAYARMKECERFFRSQWFQELSPYDINPDELINRLDMMVSEDRLWGNKVKTAVK